MGASRVFTPVYIIFFLKNIKKFKKDKLETLKKVFKGWLKSCLYVSIFASSYQFTGTFYLESIIRSGTLSPWNGFLLCSLFSVSVLLDNKSRWSEVSIWILGQWLEGYAYSLHKRKYIPQFPGIHVKF